MSSHEAHAEVTTMRMLAIVLALIAGSGAASAQDALPQRVSFPSADGKTLLVGYLFMPGKEAGRVPAVVMMHGRAGAYSNLAKGRYEAATLSRRHRTWGEFWAAQGYVAVLVDGFGPRGYPSGFPRFSYDNRPDAVNEVTARPLDAYGALAWLRHRSDVAGDLVGLQGWSNGGSASLAAMAAGPGFGPPGSLKGFSAAVAFYPGCRLRGRFEESDYRPYAPMRVFHGTDDEETSFRRCRRLVEGSLKRGADIEITPYPGATHGFDDPGRARQRNPANQAAKSDATVRAQRFFAERLMGR